MPDKKKCFIIMPITTPEEMMEKYRDRDQHFSHVLNCLFVPSIEKAGFAPIPPIAKGSDLIHADIIGNLETSDLVLCDMSCLNPNVFFEFGIRTSLNKPVCVVKDEHTKKVPFDTGILNYQEYKSSLNSWELEAEVTKLAEHVRVSAERSKGLNTLWRYFGMKSKAEAYQAQTGSEEKLDYLAMQMDSLREMIGALEERGGAPGAEPSTTDKFTGAVDLIHRLSDRTDLAPEMIYLEDPRSIVVEHKGALSPAFALRIKKIVSERFRFRVRFNRLESPTRSEAEGE